MLSWRPRLREQGVLGAGRLGQQLPAPQGSGAFPPCGPVAAAASPLRCLKLHLQFGFAALGASPSVLQQEELPAGGLSGRAFVEELPAAGWCR